MVASSGVESGPGRVQPRLPQICHPSTLRLSFCNATMLGGSLDAGPTEDGGFLVAAVLPVSHPEEEA